MEKIIKKALNLSDTIEIAIKDLWLRNSKMAKNDGTEFNAEHFADLFIKNYYAKDSNADVWENEWNLNKAKKRIAESTFSE